MTSLKQIYKCNICGNVIEVVGTGIGELVCCNQPMELLTAKTQDQGMEKHVPVIEKTEKGIVVKIGEIPHPMEENHFIQWIELIADGKVFRQHLQPGQSPEATFCVCAKPESFTAREYCNLHGLWERK